MDIDILPKSIVEDAHVRHYYHVNVYQEFNRHQVFIVFANPVTRRRLSQQFKERQYAVSSVDNIEVAYLQLLRKKYNLLLLDETLPDVEALRKRLKRDPRFDYLMIVSVAKALV